MDLDSLRKYNAVLLVMCYASGFFENYFVLELKMRVNRYCQILFAVFSADTEGAHQLSGWDFWEV